MTCLSTRDLMPDSDNAKDWKQVSLWVLAFSRHKGDTFSAQVWEYRFIQCRQTHLLHVQSSRFGLKIRQRRRKKQEKNLLAPGGTSNERLFCHWRLGRVRTVPKVVLKPNFMQVVCMQFGKNKNNPQLKNVNESKR